MQWDKRGEQVSPVCQSLREKRSRGGGYQSELEGSSPVSDTRLMFGQCGKYLSPCLKVTLFRHFGEVGGLGEQLIMIIL